ncbi:cation diffusion facilitator family transporter [Arthrobacter sp. RIT-PI-e]|uniref:cation diffusion facilitator family transporter n=1 Tax=Arthrobacter sp. RIT-PI-e TaxID=1681197 RepID=UPI000675ED84|nr:cation diffusion facilitator family transporter [Arthrobacter sp. RIT-PI-e]KNC19239.1 cation diffusion facilitator family transporter [Arthrobacter sp. RIT-PI-e]
MTVIIAFTANLLVAGAKSFAALVTGAAALTPQAAPSRAATGNQIFLLVAERKSRRHRDRSPPMGYGREAYVWSMFAAFGLFTAGAVVSITHGIQQLLEPESAGDYGIAYAVLAFAFVLEGISFLQAYRQARKAGRERGTSTLRTVSDSSDPTLRAVFAEDSAALVGLVLAFTGILLHQVTGSPVPDAIGSILVGVLLGVVAVILIDRNRRFLVGQAVSPDLLDLVAGRLGAHPSIERITYLHLEYVGPGRLYLVAAVGLVGDHVGHDVAVTLRAGGRAVEEHEHIEEAVLTPSTPDEPTPGRGPAAPAPVHGGGRD